MNNNNKKKKLKKRSEIMVKYLYKKNTETCKTVINCENEVKYWKNNWNEIIFTGILNIKKNIFIYNFLMFFLYFSVSSYYQIYIIMVFWFYICNFLFFF